MAQVIEDFQVRLDVVEALRNLAGKGAGVRELVKCIQLRLGLGENALLPVLWYFMKAFHLSLGDVLPLREWLGTANDEEIDALILPAIKRAEVKRTA